jgi:predicted Zn-dependent protease
MNNRNAHTISPEEYELIDAYLQGELEANANAEVEQRINTDPVFREKLEELRYLAIGISEAALRKQLDRFHQTMTPSIAPVHTLPPTGRSWQFRWIAIAASLLIIASAAWWLFGDGRTPNERLYSAYFSPDIGLPVAMGSEDSTSYTFYDGMISYKEERYADAINKWQSIAASSGFTDTLRYYFAMALLNNKKNTEAEAMLKELTTMNQPAFLDDAYWYLALIRLKNDDRTGAADYLEKIKDGRPEAKELLAKIKP